MRNGYLVTVNLQHLYEGLRNSSFRAAVFENRHAKRCLDGRGARLVFQRYCERTLPLAAGNEVLRAKLDKSCGQRVLVIGSDRRSVHATGKRYLNTEFVHYDADISSLDSSSASCLAAMLVDRFGRDYGFIAIALGVPKQEILAAALAPLLVDVPILCIGGSFEMLSGRLKRAPALLQVLGLEGIWRFLIQPTRQRFIRIARTYTEFLYFIANRKRVAALMDNSDER